MSAPEYVLRDNVIFLRVGRTETRLGEMTRSEEAQAFRDLLTRAWDTFQREHARAAHAEAERDAARAQFETLALATIDNGARCDALETALQQSASELDEAAAIISAAFPSTAKLFFTAAEKARAAAESPAGRQLNHADE